MLNKFPAQKPKTTSLRSQEILWGTLHSNKFEHNKSLPKRKLIPLTEREDTRAEQKFIVCYKTSLALPKKSKVPPGEFSLLNSQRISRTFKLIEKNLLFHGNVNMKFIKFEKTKQQRASELFPGVIKKAADETRNNSHWLRNPTSDGELKRCLSQQLL